MNTTTAPAPPLGDPMLLGLSDVCGQSGHPSVYSEGWDAVPRDEQWMDRKGKSAL